MNKNFSGETFLSCSTRRRSLVQVQYGSLPQLSTNKGVISVDFTA